MLLPLLLSPSIERLHTGFRYTEGAAVDAKGNFYFTDVPHGRVYRRTTEGKLTVLTRRSGGCVGLDVDREGRLWAAQSAGGALLLLTPPRWSPKVRATGLGRPNDLVSDGKGGVFVTSPAFGKGSGEAIYYVSPDGRAKRVAASVKNPNGIGLSPDGRTLYVVGYGTHDLHAFTVHGGGRLGPGRRLMKLAGRGGKQANTGGDGMAVGPDGTLFVAIPEAKGIHVADATGRFLRFVALPEKPSNCAVTRDGRVLFVTAQRSVYRVQL
ncbi:MAG: SMP-30/gluconolactonase/LRE family protein [Fimbriimonas sp.]